MPVNNQVKSKRELAMERMKAKYPDKSFDDDESFFGQINDDYDDYDKKLSESQQREQAFSDMFTSDPRSARLMMEWKNGNDPAVALIRIYGHDILDAVDDPEKQEAIKQANKEFAEKVAQESLYEETYNTNLEQSLSKLEEYAAQRSLPDDVIDSAMETLITICKDVLLGKFSTNTVDMIIKAQNYDADVEQAAIEGEVAGRNAKIEEKLRKSNKGDGTPHLDSKNVMRQPKLKYDLGALDRYDDDSRDIYERGGMKRNPKR